MTAADLALIDFGPEIDRVWYCELVDLWCSPECLFAKSEADACECRCNGGHHGDLRRPMADRS